MTMPSATMPSSPTIRHKCPKPGPSHAHHMTSRLTRRLLPLAADARTRVYRPSAVSSPPDRAPGREDRGSFLPYSPGCPAESGYSRKLLYCLVYRYALGSRLSAASLPPRVGPLYNLLHGRICHTIGWLCSTRISLLPGGLLVSHAF